jgi:hypothetical protein
MPAKFNMTPLAGKKLLVAPLDWGLGHATRCIPIIKELLKNNCTVWLAGEGAQEILLKKEFPHLPFLPLKGYRIRFAAYGLAGKLVLQIPKILSAIRQEHQWLNEQIRKYGFDAVISDNRYGLYHKELFTVFITHQLTIKSPWGKWSEQFLQQWNYRYIGRFRECWVPDEEGENNLAGELSHPQKMPPVPVKYTGYLSRFVLPDDTFYPANSRAEQGENNHLLILLSGPEPQRSILEKIICAQLASYAGTATVVRGLPDAKNNVPSSGHIVYYNHLPATQLKEEMRKASYVISRPGYSTVMDIAALQIKSILVPTPGQTEQEYLAAYLQKKQFAYCVNQNAFSLLNNLEEARQFNFQL